MSAPLSSSPTVVLATGNRGKLQEMTDLLAPLGWQVRPQSDYFSDEAVEDGLSFIENALIKARFAAEKTGLPAMADDSGLEVPILQGAPGIYSSRYAGSDATDQENVQKLLKVMANVPPEDRQASFYCAMVYVRFAEDPTPVIGLGRWQGEILTAPQGDGGFGYDPIFGVPALGCSASELSKVDKQALSHRGQAMRALLAELQTTLLRSHA